MTWTRTGSEYPAQCANGALSDAAYRTHHEVITWVSSLEQMSLRVPKRLIRNITFSENYLDACRELVDAGYWKDHGDEFEIVHHADTIRASIGAQRDQRENAKQRQRKHRKKRDVPPGQTPGTDPRDNRGDVTRDITRDITRDVTGDVTPNPVCLTSTSLSEAREVPARENDERAHRRDEGLTPARTYLGEP